MFGELISFIEVLMDTVIDFRTRKLGAERRAAISALLETYFYLKDATDEGELLVKDAQPNPVEVIKSLNELDAKDRLAKWDYVLRRQTFRLMRVSDRIFGQDFIDVVTPNLREKLYEVIGSKHERTTSLHGIGAALFFRGWVENSAEEAAHYVNVLVGEEDDLLHMDKITAEIAALREAMESYRIIVNELASSDEILLLSDAARKATLLSDLTKA